ncbi:N-terminal cleavage protein [Opitutaceae bacterium TAV5]|nr:N-terminal cleavage protein [Opitutaceae bacterium TAV5]
MNSLRKYTKNDMCRKNMDTNDNTTGAPARNEVPCFRRAKAFTLIELLTVIAIIGILAAILLPTLSHVRQTAKQTQNIARLRSIGMACQLYANDNRGIMPSTVRKTNGKAFQTPGPVLWANQAINLLSLLSDKWQGTAAPVWGNTDYLPGPDAFYGPFTGITSEGRQPGKFKDYTSADAYVIGYCYYSLPGEADGNTPSRAPLADGLSNDRNDRDYLRMTPLLSDITNPTGNAGLWENLAGGFSGKKISVVRLDGSVASLDRDYINSLDSGGSIKALGGLTP